MGVLFPFRNYTTIFAPSTVEVVAAGVLQCRRSFPVSNGAPVVQWMQAVLSSKIKTAISKDRRKCFSITFYKGCPIELLLVRPGWEPVKDLHVVSKGVQEDDHSTGSRTRARSQWESVTSQTEIHDNNPADTLHQAQTQRQWQEQESLPARISEELSTASVLNPVPNSAGASITWLTSLYSIELAGSQSCCTDTHAVILFIKPTRPFQGLIHANRC